jgi:hypothetical protein
LAWLRGHGAVLNLRTDIRRVERGSVMRYRVVAGSRNAGRAALVDCDEVVLAVPPYASARLLEGLADVTLIAELKRFQYLPITTAYLGWSDTGPPAGGVTSVTEPGGRSPGAMALPALLALRESPAQQRFAQWFFDRGRQAGWRVAALVLSDSRAARDLGDIGLGEALVRQVQDELGLPAPAQLSLIHEKRATFACTPDRPRLGVDAAGAGLPGLVLAGDYTYADYPATLEGAVAADAWPRGRSRRTEVAGSGRSPRRRKRLLDAVRGNHLEALDAPLGSIGARRDHLAKAELDRLPQPLLPRGDGRISPVSPISPKTARPAGSARFFSDDRMARTTARSAAGSEMRTPPTALTKTSWSNA